MPSEIIDIMHYMVHCLLSKIVYCLVRDIYCLKYVVNDIFIV